LLSKKLGRGKKEKKIKKRLGGIEGESGKAKKVKGEVPPPVRLLNSKSATIPSLRKKRTLKREVKK